MEASEVGSIEVSLLTTKTIDIVRVHDGGALVVLCACINREET